MKKLSKKIVAIIGTTAMAISLMALPVLAGTAPGQGNGWVNQMQSFMQQTFSPGQHQTLMNSPAMQNIHNSAAMQQAMQTGDVETMQDLMNSDTNLKAYMGEENLNKMNQFMSQFGGKTIKGSSNSGSKSTMMNGTTSTGNSMMNF
ncbi:hypothetical protein REC12_07805 [Desulfosporosinus sp. PR]|uniref:hypothetical protein n=1 Tax=Candidatus Desulfosporosinus nitrosoreducens TaxID=3401928 RepID=UPI0027F53B04|nr:hypothetical protein [Desulfosporosinus sp. PR]MDQ7093490.1 hypothetical protein [Desulfosporosinus sp. PR]